MNDMQRDLDELGRRLWPRSDVLRPALIEGGALGRMSQKRRRRLNVLAIVAVAAVVVAVLAAPIVLWRLESRHTAPAVPPQPTAKVSPRSLFHHNGQIVMGVANSLIAIDPATGRQSVILSVPTGDVVSSPGYSPDGTKLAYLRGRVVDSSGNVGAGPDAMDSIWILDTKAGHARQLTTCNRCSPYDYISWSPDGSRLAFSEADQRGSLQLDLIDADGTHRTQLTHFPAAQNATEPTWSPDGTRIAFTFFRVANTPSHSIVYPTVNIEVIRPDGAGLAVLIAGNGQGDGPYREPAWSPDGSRIAYVIPLPSEPPPDLYQLWLMNPDGSHRTFISINGELAISAPIGIPIGLAWSPDGTRIALVHDGALRVMNADASASVSLGAFSGERPAWQPVP